MQNVWKYERVLESECFTVFFLSSSSGGGIDLCSVIRDLAYTFDICLTKKKSMCKCDFSWQLHHFVENVVPAFCRYIL